MAAHVDEAEAYPRKALKVLGEQGLMGLYIPEAYGGTGLGTLAFCLAVEEIAWACASTAIIYLVQYVGGWPIVAAGTEEQKRRYLPAPGVRRDHGGLFTLGARGRLRRRLASPRAPFARAIATS